MIHPYLTSLFFPVVILSNGSLLSNTDNMNMTDDTKIDPPRFETSSDGQLSYDKCFCLPVSTADQRYAIGESLDILYFGIILFSIHSDTYLIFYILLSKPRLVFEPLPPIRGKQI